jgi:NAD(P)-dependent dehydrogenase (short-subunit alcohol dehydrogenase family)
MPNTQESQPVAVVTGASQGLGRALTRDLAGEGWTVVVDGRDRDRLTRAVTELTEYGDVVGVGGDITDEDHRRELARTAAHLGSVRLVVNNASTLGASPLPSVLAIEPDVLHRVFDVNVVAPVQLLQQLGTHLAEGATIVNITSDAAVEAYEGWGGYGASKAALEHISRILAIERPDLRVLVVDPGDMRTQMHQDAFPGEDISDRDPPEASVPGLMALIQGDETSGRYRAKEIEADERRTA